jgi:hypothetical protein
VGVLPSVGELAFCYTDVESSAPVKAERAARLWRADNAL